VTSSRSTSRADTHLGAVASTRIEDAIYGVPGIALCAAGPVPDPEHPGYEHAVTALQLHPDHELDLSAISAAVATLPEYARPRRLRVVDAIPLTDGFRPIKRGLAAMVAESGSAYVWDARTQRYHAALEAIRAS